MAAPFPIGPPLNAADPQAVACGSVLYGGPEIARESPQSPDTSSQKNSGREDVVRERLTESASGGWNGWVNRGEKELR